MPDEHIFIAHRCGYAVHFGKQTANQYSFYVEGLNHLSDWLTENNPDGFWDSYNSEANQEPWIVLSEGMGCNRGFRVFWTTPSGLMFCDSDYIDGKKSYIFRVIFLDDDLSGISFICPNGHTARIIYDDIETEYIDVSINTSGVIEEKLLPMSNKDKFISLIKDVHDEKVTCAFCKSKLRYEDVNEI